MEFRSLSRQYDVIRDSIDKAISDVISETNFISGRQVRELEEKLENYVNVKHCITCANGTDALSLALMAWGIGRGDAVFVPDFTFFSSGEVVSFSGATPFFVDVDYDTFNIDYSKLEQTIKCVIREGKFVPKAIVVVDLFGQPADYYEIRRIADAYGLYILEDGAQGFGGAIQEKKNCSFGDIATTSFFPMKPLGCYGDGGAVFTNNDEWAELIESYCVHGKGSMKYDNVRIGMNSRLDTVQAAILLAKLEVFDSEVQSINCIADYYSELLRKTICDRFLQIPHVRSGYFSSWAQYTIKLNERNERDELQSYLKTQDIPSFVYYPKPMHRQIAFSFLNCNDCDFEVANKLSECVLSLPISPYMKREEVDKVVHFIAKFYGQDSFYE